MVLRSCGPDDVWKIEVAPGTDNSWAQVPGCFTDTQKLEYVRQLERLACIDAGRFSITLLITRRENVSGFKAWASILLELKELSRCRCKEDFLAWHSKLSRSDSLGLFDWLDLWSVRDIVKVSRVKAIDRSRLGLYTREKSGVQGKEYFWLVDTQGLNELVSCISSVDLEALQEIDLSFSAKCFSNAWCGFELEGSDAMSLLNYIDKLVAKKQYSSLAEVKDSSAVGFNYNLYGYNLGVYN